MADVRWPVMEEVSPREDVSAKPHSRLRGLARGLGFKKREAAERNKFLLDRVMEFDIVPRLAMAHPARRQEFPGVEPQEDFSDEILAFAELTLGKNADGASDHIHSMFDKGIPLEKIYLKLLSPTARYLRYLWLDDQRYFAEITLGLWRLQQLLREFSKEFRADADKSHGLRVLLTTEPVEVQELCYLMFSLSLAGEFHRRGGWDAWIEPLSSSAFSKVHSTVKNEWFDVCEFSASSPKRLDQLASSIKMVRETSLNKSLGILLCGQIFIQHPEFVLQVGGDMAAAEPIGAVVKAQHLVHSSAKRA